MQALTEQGGWRISSTAHDHPAKRRACMISRLVNKLIDRRIWRTCRVPVRAGDRPRGIFHNYFIFSPSLRVPFTAIALWPVSRRCFTVVVVGEDGLVRTHTDHWSVASLLETKVGWVYNVGRRAFGAATSVLFGWLTRDSTPPALAGGAPHAPSAPPIAEVVSVNPKAD